MDSDTDPDMSSLTDLSNGNYSTDGTESEISELETNKGDSDCLDSDDENTGTPPLPSTHSTQLQQTVFKGFDACTDVVCLLQIVQSIFGPRNMKGLTTTNFQHCALQ